MYDVSTEAHFEGGIGSNYVKPLGAGDNAFVSFNIGFSADLKSFTGKFSNDNEKTIFNWTGTSFVISDDIRQLIQDRVTGGSAVAPSDARKTLTSATVSESAPAPSSSAVDTYLPAAISNNSLPRTPGVLLANVAADTSMSELNLWHISSIQGVTDGAGNSIATDIVQAYVGTSANNVSLLNIEVEQ